MRKIKLLENEIEVLRRELLGLQDYIFEKKFLSIEEAKRRDYIVRTNYYGKLTDTNIKKDFKAKIEQDTKDKFDSIKTKILNYEFFDRDIPMFILDNFYETLKEYEKKQIVLDTYGGK
jgi:hypothetical protein